ncbi:hypothetical protein VSS74_01330 [Conexibacter stalactiti]|uniref:Uncharacterized protein n=1 Tax=Conexibacter stalactiti TaxID=1940611 RepID=A0ABU4HI19_9ACTN|nr:hypothetical protein [Conexibacter stalactiti]MDW5592959.1 hypothetical protein [Conexibacter stalactiti]MEC5033600.1 hypothetical protein [Conexibacter stalactiti]
MLIAVELEAGKSSAPASGGRRSPTTGSSPTSQPSAASASTCAMR